MKMDSPKQWACRLPVAVFALAAILSVGLVTPGISLGQIPDGDFLSDDFNACVLKPIWTFVDPQGDATLPAIQGGFSGDAKVGITVPGGSSHELYNGVIGAPYIIQDTSDSDFTVVVKFDSVMPAVNFAEQGIIVRQDDTDWLRLEFYTLDTDEIAILAGLPNNSFPNNTGTGLPAGSSPMYMRVQRAGDTWTQSYSTDGTNWTDLASFDYVLTVTGVGLYAGNAGANPEHTVLVDYFSNSLDPIVEPDDTGQNTLTTSIVGNGTIDIDLDLPVYDCGDVVQLTANPSAGWAFDGWSGDVVSNDNPLTVTMDMALDLTATFIFTGPPQPPVAVDDEAEVVTGSSVDVDVLANDTDVNNDIDPSTVTVVNQPFNGSITNIDAGSGAIRYLHDGGVAVADSFTYTVEDHTGRRSNQAMVRIQIVPSVPPVAQDDFLTVLVGSAGDVDVMDNDSANDGTLDPGTVTVVDIPLNGTVTNIDPLTGVITYLHDGGTELADSFTYTVQDNHGTVSNLATVWVTIEPLVAPTAVDDAVFVFFNSTVDADVLFNDTAGSAAIDPATVTIVDSPAHGFITNVNPANGVVTYAHDGGTDLADSFTYTVDDINGATSNIATVSVTIGQVSEDEFVSDDFNACDLKPIWTFVDPQGDTTQPTIEGAFSGDAKVAITVPGGSSHELFDGVIGAPYIIQGTTDTDFTLVSDTEWLRLEFYSLGSDQIAILAGLPDNSFPNNTTITGQPAGTSPVYMRIERAGDSWTQSYSTDGTNWTSLASFDYVLTVTGVGLYAGNAGDNPGHTVLVDYFSNSQDPIVEPDDTELNILTTHVIGTGTIDLDPDLPAYDCGDVVQLTANPSAGWIFDSWSGDLTGSANPTTVTMEGPLDVTATFTAQSSNLVFANTSGVPGISTGFPCASGIPVRILREAGDDMRGFTVTFALTNLDLCDGIASINEGDYLSSISGTSFNITDNQDGTYDVEASITGEPCGASALTGTLFTLDVTNTIPNGTGTIDVTGVQLRNCSDLPLLGEPGGPADIVIDTTPPASVTNLTFSKVMTGNPAGNVMSVELSWTPSTDPDATLVSVYRKGFGAYPEFSDGGGSAPVLPTDPINEGWIIVAVVPVGSNVTTDLAANRDYWYFCTQTFDALGNPSTAVMTGGVLNYLMGDVSDGGNPIQDGDNHVWTEDLTLFGAHYGTNHGDPLYLNTLDIGPSSDMSVEGLPTTDNMIQFEDLILFGLNYGLDAVSAPDILAFVNVPPPASSNTMALHLPDLPEIGQTFQADLVMSGDGQIQGLNIPLAWDAEIVEPVAVQGGPLLTEQGGSSLVLSSAPGVVDVCLAGIRESGISGVGRVASVTFKLLGAGDPAIQLTDIDARNQENDSVSVTTTEASPVGAGEDLPVVSTLHPNYPNPFNPMTTIAFDLAVSGRVRIDIYSVDGRRIRTLIDGSYVAGRHTEVWNGRDQAGRAVASGTYLYIMEGPGIKQTRRMLLIK